LTYTFAWRNSANSWRSGDSVVVVPAAGFADRTCLTRQLHLPLLRKQRHQFVRQADRQVRTRRLNGRGYLKLLGHQFAVGREHASKIVTVVLEEDIATVLEGEQVLRQIVINWRIIDKKR
jgi:hypothetical protein